MLKYSSIAVVAGMLAFVGLPTIPAAAQGGIELPGGDSLDFTPPADITQKQVRAAPRRDRRKFHRIADGTYVPMRRHSHRVSADTARGQ